jgi:hypothetical protein
MEMVLACVALVACSAEEPPGPGQVLARGAHLEAVAVDGDYVYWAEIRYDNATAVLRRMPSAGGPVDELATVPPVLGEQNCSSRPMRVGVDELFVSTRDGIYVLPKAGGAAVRVAWQSQWFTIGDDLYTIEEVGFDGSTLTLHPAGQAEAVAIALPNVVHYAYSGDSDGKRIILRGNDERLSHEVIASIALDGSDVRVISEARDNCLAVTAGHVWSARTDLISQIEPGPPENQRMPFSENVGLLRPFGDTLFWYAPWGLDYFMAWPAGHSPSLAVALDTVPDDLAVDGTGIYFTVDGTLRRIPRPGPTPAARRE